MSVLTRKKQDEINNNQNKSALDSVKSIYIRTNNN